jgi:hypothetical protein
MKLNIMAMAIVVGVVWAGCILFVGLSHLVWPSYGGAFLAFAASVYPGFHPAGGVGAIIVGTLYALLDGAFGGAVIAWLYNRCTRAV